jgi:type IV secretion system protein VirB1
MRVSVILPLAIVTTLAVTCAPQVAPATLAAIAQTESGLDPLAVGDNTAQRSYHPAAKPEAIALAAQLAAEGHDLDLGLMQINRRNFGWLGLAGADAFEPCRSLAAGAAVLTALSRYNTGKSSSPTGMDYARRVLSQGKGGDVQQQWSAEPNLEAKWRMFDNGKGDTVFSSVEDEIR